MQNDENLEPEEEKTPVEQPEETTEEIIADESIPNKTGKKGLFAALAILIIIAGLSFKFLYNTEPAPPSESIISLEQAKHLSDSLYNELKRALAVYKQENEELYSQIARKESELESQYSKIKRLIKQAGRDKSAKKEIQSKLQNLGLELKNLKIYVENQTLDLEELRVENRRLIKEKEKLDALYASELEEKQRLLLEGEVMNEANEELNRKLNTASVLQSKGINAQILKIKANGERKKVHLAKNGELIEVCFEIVRNEVCEQGANRFFLLIKDPTGAVVSDQNRGSGKLTLFDNNQQIGYTTCKIFDYNTSVQKLCMEWYAYPTTMFRAGTYSIELYNKGRQVGQYKLITK